MNNDIPLPDHIRQHFAKIHSESNLQSSFDEFLRDNLYFVTATFDPKAFERRAPDPSAAIDLFRKWYVRQCRRAFPNNLSKRKLIQPLTYVFVDFEGTRHIAASADSLKGLAHVHALMLIIPQGEIFRPHILNAARLAQYPADIDICAFDPKKSNEYDRDPFDHLVLYCSKGARALSKKYSGKHDLWDLLPR